MNKNTIEWHLIADGDYPTTAGEYLVTMKAPWLGGRNPVTVDIVECGNNISPYADQSLVLPNGFAFGQDWHGEMDNLDDVIAWAEKPAPYMGE